MNNTIMQQDLSIKDEMESLGLKEVMEELLGVRHLYNSAIMEVRTKLEILDNDFRFKFDHNPIHHMKYRLKSMESILEKANRRNVDMDIDSIKEEIYDIAGIRVICNYIDDIYKVYDSLKAQDDIHEIVVKDYIKNPKENGYRSLHVVIKVPVFLSGEKEYVPVEIQIRTIAMDFWASLEHNMKYKTKKDVPQSVKNELTDCALAITNLDEKMQNIYRFLELETDDTTH